MLFSAQLKQREQSTHAYLTSIIYYSKLFTTSLLVFWKSRLNTCIRATTTGYLMITVLGPSSDPLHYCDVIRKTLWCINHMILRGLGGNLFQVWLMLYKKKKGRGSDFFVTGIIIKSKTFLFLCLHRKSAHRHKENLDWQV